MKPLNALHSHTANGAVLVVAWARMQRFIASQCQTHAIEHIALTVAVEHAIHLV